MAAATAGKQLWGEQTLVLGLEATILHNGDARATQHFARFGAAYALLHPEQQGRAGQGQGFAGVVGAIVGGPEQAHYIRLESQPRQVAQAGGGGHAPHCFAYRVDRKDAVTGGHEITSHPIHGRAGLVLGAQDGDGRGPGSAGRAGYRQTACSHLGRGPAGKGRASATPTGELRRAVDAGGGRRSGTDRGKVEYTLETNNATGSRPPAGGRILRIRPESPARLAGRAETV